MAFKTKTKTRLLIDDRQTLDAKHNNILTSFTNNKETLSELYVELLNVNKKLNDLNIVNNKSPMFDIEIQKIIWLYDDKKNELEININRIENNIDENDYMLNTGKLISNYYKIINEEKKITIKHNKIDTKIDTNIHTNIDTNIDSTIEIKIENNDINNYKISKKHKNKNITDWFNNNEEDLEHYSIKTQNLEIPTIKYNTNDSNETTEPTDTTETNETNDKHKSKDLENVKNKYNTHENNDIHQDLENSKRKYNKTETNDVHQNLENPEQKYNTNENDNTFKNNINKYKNQKTQIFMHQSKDIIYDKYMKLIDKNYISTINNNKDIFDNCMMCNIEMLLNNNTGQLTCPNCGFIENIIVDSDKPSFKEPPKEMTSFCYKRINHLNEFLAQFQAKETTDIPESVYNDIIMEIKKERIKNMAVITPDKMRTILKKIKKNDYYEHIPYIINQLNGLPAPVIAPEIEEIIRGMFKAIQIPFEKYCPFKRKNFLSYNYVMYKFFELLELDEYLTCFQLLKSRTKLHQQDQIWKNICKDLNWQYINSL
jgi:hypothetical protein